MVPELDMKLEKKLQDSLLYLIKKGFINSAHDCSEGGLAIALAESCISNRNNTVGADITLDDNIRTDCLLFGETQSRVVISCSFEKVEEISAYLKENGIHHSNIGTTGGKRLKINDMIDLPLEKLAESYYKAMPSFMEHGQTAPVG